MRRNSLAQTLLRVGFTAILLGYFLVWLPQPVVGLSFIGLELGEWVKFIPQLRSGELGINRNIFYLPPITLSLMIILWTTNWPNNNWQTWVTRFLAIVIAFLTFPALESILGEPPAQWLFRILLISLVVIFAAVMPLVQKWPHTLTGIIPWIAIMLLGFVGGILPTWAYFSITPVVEELVRTHVGAGLGLWLNLSGHLMASVIALYYASIGRFSV